ncbi:MAG: GGDEF domain-containing protein [Sphaerochaetaceae bacterium]|nr:GGDEF domain-containing protein [Sphaerochaetaceae bacterium]
MITIENGRPVDKRSNRIYLFIITAVILAVLAQMFSLYTDSVLNQTTTMVRNTGSIRGNMQQTILHYTLELDASEQIHTIDTLLTELLSSLSSHRLLFTQEHHIKASNLEELWREGSSMLSSGKYSVEEIRKVTEAVNVASDSLITAIKDRVNTFRRLQLYATCLWIFTFLVLIVLLLLLRRSFITRLLDTSISDSLTGLRNRNFISEYIEDFCSRTRDQKDKPFRAFILADIDNFKRINDTYGHQKGDEILVSVAQTLRDLSRKESLLFRYGGEEFLLILRFPTLKDALLYTEAVRRSVQSHEHGGVTLTMSFGIGVCTGELDFHRVIGFADSALYAAKEAGRNCTFLKTPTTEVLSAQEAIDRSL